MANKLTIQLTPTGGAVASGAVAAADCKAFERTGMFQVSGTFVGTIQLEESVDGTNWRVVGAALTAPGFISADPSQFAQFVRANVTAYTSGAIVMIGVARTVVP